MKLFASVAMASAMLVSAHASAVDCSPGSYNLETQADIDGFQAAQTVPCDTVTGRLRIRNGADITNLRNRSAPTILFLVNGST